MEVRDPGLKGLWKIVVAIHRGEHGAHCKT